MGISTNGLLGACIVALAVYMVYVFGSKKSSWNLPSFGNMKTPNISGNWMLVIVGAAFFFWSMYAQRMRPAQMGDWSSDYWLQILIICGILYLLIVLNAESLGGTTARTLQGVLTVGAFLLLIGFPTWSWIVGGPASATASLHVPQQESAQAIPRDAPELPWAWNKDGSPTDMSKWPMVKIPADGGDSVHVPNIPGGHVVWAGSGFTVHCVYADGQEGIVGDEDNPCSDGDIVKSYAHNEGETELYASYAYARQSEK